MKEVKPDNKTDKNDIINEIALLISSRHPNIIRHIETYTFNKSVFIITEYIPNNLNYCLYNLHQKIPEEFISYIIRGILYGLDWLHKEHRVHRDIKPANILVSDQGEIKLCDFGFTA